MAFLVGIDEYQDGKLPSFAGDRVPSRDVRDILEVLETSHSQYEVRPEFVLLEQPIDRKKLDKQLQKLLSPDSQFENVLIYFSGHGYQTFEGDTEKKVSKGYLGTHDAQIFFDENDNPDGQRNGLSFERLGELIEKATHLKSLVLWLDACHSGFAMEDAFMRSALEKLPLSCRYSILASAHRSEAAYSGVFASAIVERLQQQELGPITAQTIANYVVSKLEGQRPVDRSSKDDLILLMDYPLSGEFPEREKGNESINTYRKNDIYNYLKQRFPKRHFNGELHENKKLEGTVWRWLSPYTSLENLSGLKARTEANLLDRDFAEQLFDLCQNVPQEALALEKWVWRRLALLEYAFRPPLPLPRELLEVNLRLRVSLSTLSTSLQQEQIRQIQQDIQLIVSQSLAAAALTTCRILGKTDRGCDLWANLMIPIDTKSETISSLTASEQGKANYDRATQLWRHCPPAEKILGIVAKTEDTTEAADQSGFWVPAARSPTSSRTPLPGAATAYLKQTASAVFVDDLPPLDGFSPQLEKEWQDYMQKEFEGTVFVSIPFGFERNTLAVLNVNARPPQAGDWRRAYHEQWLNAVEEQVSLFACEAYLGYKLQCAIFGKVRE